MSRAKTVSQIKNPHDINFKQNFTNHNVAVDFLKYNLPSQVLAKVDVDTVKIEPNELMPSKYRSSRHADIIYSVKSKESKKIYIIVHLEAQSRHDPLMVFRVWDYQTGVAKGHYKQGHKKYPLF